MSHFCVYVFHDKDTSIDKLLAPYDEHLIVTHKVCTRNELLKKYKKEYPDKYEKINENHYKHALNWYGYSSDGDDVISEYNDNAKWDWYVVGGRWSDTITNNENILDNLNIDDIDVPYAFVTPNGEWVEKGQMGWFGLSSNDMDKDEWDNKFKEYIKTLDKNLILTQVDCHI